MYCITLLLSCGKHSAKYFYALFITIIILEIRKPRLREIECHTYDMMEPEFDMKSS